MKISVDDDGTLVIGEVFSGAYLETAEGNRIGFCMRDDTIEFNVLPKETKENDKWFRVNMQTRRVEEMDPLPSKAVELTNAIIDDLQRHHIQFGEWTNTDRDMVAEKIVEPFLREAASHLGSRALELTNAIITNLNRDHHIKFDGRLTHTGRDMVSEDIVEPFLRALDEQKKTDGGG